MVRPLESWLTEQCLLHIMQMLLYDFFYVHVVFPGGLDRKESVCSAEDSSLIPE